MAVFNNCPVKLLKTERVSVSLTGRLQLTTMPHFLICPLFPNK